MFGALKSLFSVGWGSCPYVHVADVLILNSIYLLVAVELIVPHSYLKNDFFSSVHNLVATLH